MVDLTTIDDEGHIVCAPRTEGPAFKDHPLRHPGHEYNLYYQDGSGTLDWERLAAEQRAAMTPEEIQMMENRAASILADFKSKNMRYRTKEERGEVR